MAGYQDFGSSQVEFPSLTHPSYGRSNILLTIGQHSKTTKLDQTFCLKIVTLGFIQ
jgi:hypothetical protein